MPQRRMRWCRRRRQRRRRCRRRRRRSSRHRRRRRRGRRSRGRGRRRSRRRHGGAHAEEAMFLAAVLDLRRNHQALLVAIKQLDSDGSVLRLAGLDRLLLFHERALGVEEIYTERNSQHDHQTDVKDPPSNPVARGGDVLVVATDARSDEVIALHLGVAALPLAYIRPLHGARLPLGLEARTLASGIALRGDVTGAEVAGGHRRPGKSVALRPVHPPPPALPLRGALSLGRPRTLFMST
mmetsp:Transcript_74558/g.210246  ORF Transcript_74558/g.210246 Transcript_74558/m.210246 type:complete len:239 (+) Transcript_74558:422-1138(+)